MEIPDPKYLTIGVFDSITNIGLWAVKNVPVDSYLNDDNFENELWNRFQKVTGLVPKNEHGVVIKYVWRIVDSYAKKIK